MHIAVIIGLIIVVVVAVVGVIVFGLIYFITHRPTVLSGTSDPTVLTGSNGDFFLNTSTGVLYGPKLAGVWPSTGLVVGGSVKRLWNNYTQATPDPTVIATAGDYHIPLITTPPTYLNRGTTGSSNTYFQVDATTEPTLYPGFKINTAGKYRIRVDLDAKLASGSATCNFLLRKSASVSDDTAITVSSEILYKIDKTITTEYSNVTCEVVATLAAGNYITLHVSNKDNAEDLTFGRINTEIVFIE